MNLVLITDVSSRKHILNLDHVVSVFFNEANGWYYITLADGNNIRIVKDKFPLRLLEGKEGWLDTLRGL